jgi:hypothetical protein
MATHAPTEVSALPRVHLHRIAFRGLPSFDFGRPQDSMNSSRRMTEIKAFRSTYRGTAEGDHGVFTYSDGTVYAGSIADGSACVGVVKTISGNTFFVECDADGEAHGRALDYYADGDTWYILREHGTDKETAVLNANGTCAYNREWCRADYAPFVALRAKVMPIKARPPLVAPCRLLCRIFSPPSRSNRPLLWHAQELATAHADKVRACRLRHQPAWASWHSSCKNECTARPTWTTHRAEWVHDACGLVHPSAVTMPAVYAQWSPMRLRLFHHVPHALGERRGLRRAATLGFTPHAPRARRQRASPSRFAPRTSTAAPLHGASFDACAMRP